MSRWLLHIEEPTRKRLVRIIEETHRAITDDIHIIGWNHCGFEGIALRAVDAKGELEQVHVTVDGDRCMLTVRSSEAPLPDTVMLNGHLLRRSTPPTNPVDDVLCSLEHWRERMSDAPAAGSLGEAAAVRRDLSYLIRAAVQRFDAGWAGATVRSRGPGRHHIRLRSGDRSRGTTELDFVSGARRPGDGGIGGRLIEAIDEIVGEHVHVSVWNGGCPADRLPVTIGSTPFIDVGDPDDHMATMRGYAALPGGTLLIPPSTRG